MALHNGLETTAIISFGVYSKVYGSAHPGNIANLFASFGYLEDASPTPPTFGLLKINAVKRFIKFYSADVHYHNV